MISSVFRKTGKIKNPHSGIFLSCMEVQRKKQKGSPHIMTSFALKENTHSQDDRHSFFRSTKQDHSQTRQSIRIQAATDSPYYQCLLRSPWSVRRLTAKYGMSYLTYFIAFMHRFPCTFCAHFFHNSEFQQIIVVICSFSFLLFLE